jgi:5'-3' exonuclease
MGDISDNIPSVLKKCGPKTALKCYQDPEYFNERMKKENASEKFAVNQKMIDFNFIPDDLALQFIDSLTN